MLLTCPACGARYEIDGSLIPPGGRRVQCSACDHVWQEGPPPASPTPAPQAEPAATPPDAPESDAPHPDAPTDEPAAPPQRPLAEDVKAILRSEAQREARLRRERGLVEIQPELSLEPGSAQPKRRPRPASGALPDPDEINQTLRAASMRAATRDAGSRSRSGGGFVAGLIVGLCLVGLAALVYAAAPRITGAAPAAAPALESYVAAVGEIRRVLDQAVGSIAATLSDLIGSVE